MNHEEIAKKVWKDILNYNITNESFIELIETISKKYGNFKDSDIYKIETNVIHLMTIDGYEIEVYKPFKVKKY